MADDKKHFSEYFKSIYSQSNTFKAEEYENSYNHYELNFGKYLPAKMDARILEIGCGGGHFLYFLKKKGYTNYLGIDISSEAIEAVNKTITCRAEKADALSFLVNQENCYDRYRNMEN